MVEHAANGAGLEPPIVAGATARRELLTEQILIGGIMVGTRIDLFPMTNGDSSPRWACGVIVRK